LKEPAITFWVKPKAEIDTIYVEGISLLGKNILAFYVQERERVSDSERLGAAKEQ